LNQLIQKTKELKKEAQLILNDLNLESFFLKYGKVKLVGSITFGLMTWEDIDIDLVTKDKPTDELFWKVAQYLFAKESTKLLMLADNRTGLKEANRPKSMYLGLHYQPDNGVLWKLDIRLIQKNDIRETPNWMHSLNTIDKQKKLAILQIKNRLKNDPRYHKEISSVDVYNAVINHNVISYDSFMNYVTNKTIS